MNQQRESVVGELGAWTHMWFSAASLTLQQIDHPGDTDSSVASIGARDVLSLVLVDAVRNVYRGAVAVLGMDHDAMVAFNEAVPALVKIRDFFEHFDEYVAGKGRVQRAAQTDDGGGIGMSWKSSAGGGPGGHTIVIEVRQGDEGQEYEIRTTEVLDACRELIRAVLATAGLDDARHQARCGHCY